MQGALRSAFLVNAGLNKEGYVATSAGVAFLIDLSRLGVYSGMLTGQWADLDHALLIAAVLAAFAGAAAGNRYLPKVTMGSIRGIVAMLLLAVGLGLTAGIL